VIVLMRKVPINRERDSLRLIGKTK
jgi:hypothetical protein